MGAYLAYVGNQRTYTHKNSNTPISAMNLQRFLALALAPFVIVASSTFATTISECQADIANLRTETQAATITGKNAAKDQAGLIGKLDGAAVELDKGKFCDSIKKLNDFKTKEPFVRPKVLGSKLIKPQSQSQHENARKHRPLPMAKITFTGRTRPTKAS